MHVFVWLIIRLGWAKPQELGTKKAASELANLGLERDVGRRGKKILKQESQPPSSIAGMERNLDHDLTEQS
jgi:hypothetical protein